MHVSAQPFWLPKRGNALEEYEDAFWPKNIIDAKRPVFRFAVADGATETSFSDIWAKLLVRAYCKGCASGSRLAKALPKLRGNWSREIETKELPWYAEEKARQGAFSALVGLTLQSQESVRGRGTWQALAIGDSCLCQIRDHSLIAAFPISESSGFTNRPKLLASTHQSRGNEVAAEMRPGDWEVGDSFYLMTDALAQWFLCEAERGSKPWGVLEDLDTIDQPLAFGDWIGSLRSDKAMRNDDVTLLRVMIL
jgi:serine/threonine protein phosphatase PrpC